ncbi:hypothetical protein PAMA_007759 [Pampus argenteus]
MKQTAPSICHSLSSPSLHMWEESLSEMGIKVLPADSLIYLDRQTEAAALHPAFPSSSSSSSSSFSPCSRTDSDYLRGFVDLFFTCYTSTNSHCHCCNNLVFIQCGLIVISNHNHLSKNTIVRFHRTYATKKIVVFFN